MRTPEQIEAAREASRPDFSLGPAFARPTKPKPAAAAGEEEKADG